jgi:hypothetical protein
LDRTAAYQNNNKKNLTERITAAAQNSKCVLEIIEEQDSVPDDRKMSSGTGFESKNRNLEKNRCGCS